VVVMLTDLFLTWRAEGAKSVVRCKGGKSGRRYGVAAAGACRDL
jgi:hypothetical protein